MARGWPLLFALFWGLLPADSGADNKPSTQIVSLSKALQEELGKMRDIRCVYRTRGVDQGPNTYNDCVWQIKGEKEYIKRREIYEGTVRSHITAAFNGCFSTSSVRYAVGQSGKWDEGRIVWPGRARILHTSPTPGVLFRTQWPHPTPLTVLLTGTETFDNVYWPLDFLRRPMRVAAQHVQFESRRCTVVEHDPRTGNTSYKIWFDEERDLRPLRIEIRDGPDAYIIAAYYAIKLERIAGFWFPVYGREFSRSRGDPKGREGEIILTEVAINTGINDDAFTLAFPLGSSVFDNIARRAYWVGGGPPTLPVQIMDTLLK